MGVHKSELDRDSLTVCVVATLVTDPPHDLTKVFYAAGVDHVVQLVTFSDSVISGFLSDLVSSAASLQEVFLQHMQSLCVSDLLSMSRGMITHRQALHFLLFSTCISHMLGKRASGTHTLIEVCCTWCQLLRGCVYHAGSDSSGLQLGVWSYVL